MLDRPKRGEEDETSTENHRRQVDTYSVVGSLSLYDVCVV